MRITIRPDGITNACLIICSREARLRMLDKDDSSALQLIESQASLSIESIYLASVQSAIHTQRGHES